MKMMSFGALIWSFIFLFLLQRGQTTVILQAGTQTRTKPLWGLGNEILFQDLYDTQLNTIAKKLSMQVQRYPGGTPSNKWDWNSGKTRPCDWAQYTRAIGLNPSNTVYDLNVFSSNISYQLEGLKTFASCGMKIEWVEMGNEFYACGQGWESVFQNGSVYAKMMHNYTAAVKSVYPNAKVALCGWGRPWYDCAERESVWNKEVFDTTFSSQADAATIHQYYGFPANPPQNQTDVYDYYLNVINEFEANAQIIQSTIPHRFELWVTEMGPFGTTALDYTWFEAILVIARDLLIQSIDRVTVMAPYCFICGDPAEPAFARKSNTSSWEMTPVGLMYWYILPWVNQATHMTNIEFIQDEWNAKPNFVGWKYEKNGVDHGAIVVDLGLTLNATGGICGSNLELDTKFLLCPSGVDLYRTQLYVEKISDLILKGFPPSNVKVNNEKLVSNKLESAPWSVNVFSCGKVASHVDVKLII